MRTIEEFGELLSDLLKGAGPMPHYGRSSAAMLHRRREMLCGPKAEVLQAYADLYIAHHELLMSVQTQ